jgi:DNA-binding SARP family transcriptional activator
MGLLLHTDTLSAGCKDKKVACYRAGRQDDEALEDHPGASASVGGAAGVVLVDARSRVVWWSESVARRLDADGLEWTVGMRCCDALDCERNTGGPRGCLTRLTLGSAEGLAQRPWRLEREDRRLRGRLSARLVRACGRDLIAFELQFAGAPVAVAAPVEVVALGRLSVAVGGVARGGDWIQQRPGQVFRYLLAARDGPQRSEAIASALWPDRGPAAVANVRYCIFKLREHLGEREDPARSLVVREAGGYRVDAQRLRLDVDVFQRKAVQGIAAQRRGDTAEAEAALGEAMALYGGDFLADDPYADWAFTEREYLRSLAGKGLAGLAQIALANGRLVAAADHLQRLAQLEPFDSRVHQMLIEVCLRRGRRTEALRHYHALRARLHRAFGEQPDFDLAHLAATLTERS